MNTATIRLLLRCNLRCGFCNARAEHDDPSRFSAEAVSTQIDAALAAGAQELILTGGEPTLRPDLTELVRRASQTGARVVVETNAMALSLPGRAAQLAAAGAPVVRWGISALGAQMDSVGQRAGAFELGLKGVREAVTAGLEVEVAYALSGPGLDDLARVPAWLRANLPEARGLLVRVVKEAPDGFVVRPRDAAQALRALAVACSETDLVLQLDPRYALPLCALAGANQFPALFRVAGEAATGNLTRIAACETCAIDDMCAGVDRAWIARFGDADFTAVHRRHRRRARGLLSGRSAQDALRAPSQGMWSETAGSAVLERVIRVNFHCNQDCEFCFVDRVLPAPPAASVRAQIDRAAADGVALLSLSGGEPTLDPDLADHIRYATALGLRVQIQTNATRTADPALVQALADAGLAEAFISLHGATAATSDAVTRAPGTFAKTLLGIDQLLAHGVRVSLNCVITGPNHRDLVALPELIAARWGGVPTLNFSWANANSALVPIDEDVTPKFSAARPYLKAALDACTALGLDWRGLTGECGVPLCFPDAAWLDPARVPDLGHEAAGAGFIKPAECDTCVLSSRCVGVRQGYADLHGLDELRPVHSLAGWQAARGNTEPPSGHP